MNFIAIAQAGFEMWAAKPHNAKWFRRIDGTPIPNDLPVCIAQAFSDALAGRSVPEAGKAVDETLTALSGFLVFLKDMRFTGSWNLATLNRAIEVGETIAEQSAGSCKEVVDRVEDIAKIIDPHSFMDIPFTDDPALLDMVEQSKQDAIRKTERILSALASVPAPSGAEPKFDTRILPETQAALDAIDENIRSAAMRASTTFFGAPQAVPTEDVAGLIERLNATYTAWNNPPSDGLPEGAGVVLEAVTALTSLSAERDRAQESLREVQFVFGQTASELDRSEAEATSLRRNLEEHRRALVEARERINRYADTAAEHDLVARIDALAAPLPEDIHHGR